MNDETTIDRKLKVTTQWAAHEITKQLLKVYDYEARAFKDPDIQKAFLNWKRVRKARKKVTA